MENMLKKIKKNPYYYCFKPKYSQHNDKSRESERRKYWFIFLSDGQTSKLFNKVWQKYKSFILDKCIIDFTNWVFLRAIGIYAIWYHHSNLHLPLLSLRFKTFWWPGYMLKVPNCLPNEQNLVFLSLDDV